MSTRARGSVWRLAAFALAILLTASGCRGGSDAASEAASDAAINFNTGAGGRAADRQREPASPSVRDIAQVDQFEGRVVRVKDGDSLSVLTDAMDEVEIRLTEIDAPERRQPWGSRSKQALSGLAFGKRVVVHPAGRERYGRLLGRVYDGSIDINAEMVRTGNAWAYTDYQTDPAFPGLQQQARAARRGLWSLSEEPVPPWDWRHRR